MRLFKVYIHGSLKPYLKQIMFGINLYGFYHECESQSIPSSEKFLLFFCALCKQFYKSLKLVSNFSKRTFIDNLLHIFLVASFLQHL